MDNKETIMKNFAGLNSIVEFVTIDDNELYRVKIVDSIINNSQSEVTKESPIGEALMLCYEGEIITIYSQEPYKIKIISINNPIDIDNATLLNDIYHYSPSDNFIPAEDKIISTNIFKMKDGLIPRKIYGNNEKDIYQEGIKIFNWNKSKLKSFCKDEVLYDTNCTPEGYSVWFLSNSYYLDGKSSPSPCGVISNDFSRILEWWDKKDFNLYNFFNFDNRLTFIKQKDGQYIYLGIYKVKDLDTKNGRRVFYRIGTNYPTL